MLIGNAPTLHGAIAKRDRLPRMIDVRLGDELLDAIEKIRGVAVDLELDQIVAEQTAEHGFVDPDRQQAEDVGRRKGNVPELMDEQRRLHRAQKLGRQREVVVLNPGHRAAGARAPLRRRRRARSADSPCGIAPSTRCGYSKC